MQFKPGTVKTNRFEYKSSYSQAVEKDRKFERKGNYRRINWRNRSTKSPDSLYQKT